MSYAYVSCLYVYVSSIISIKTINTRYKNSTQTDYATIIEFFHYKIHEYITTHFEYLVNFVIQTIKRWLNYNQSFRISSNLYVVCKTECQIRQEM